MAWLCGFGDDAAEYVRQRGRVLALVLPLLFLCSSRPEELLLVAQQPPCTTSGFAQIGS
jgi:hypothetical protein